MKHLRFVLYQNVWVKRTGCRADVKLPVISTYGKQLHCCFCVLDILAASDQTDVAPPPQARCVIASISMWLLWHQLRLQDAWLTSGFTSETSLLLPVRATVHTTNIKYVGNTTHQWWGWFRLTSFMSLRFSCGQTTAHTAALRLMRFLPRGHYCTELCTWNRLHHTDNTYCNKSLHVIFILCNNCGKHECICECSVSCV